MTRAVRQIGPAPGFAELLPTKEPTMAPGESANFSELGGMIAELASSMLHTTFVCSSVRWVPTMHKPDDEPDGIAAVVTGNIRLALDRQLLGAAVQRAHGGGTDPVRTDSTLSATERRFLKGLSAAIVHMLNQPAPAETTIDAGLGGCVQLDFSLLHDRSETPAVFVTVQIICLATDVPAETRADEDWSARLHTSLLETRHTVRLVIARPEVSLDRLSRLKPDDFIGFVLPARVPVTVGGYQLASGTIGASDGRAAIRVEQVDMDFLNG